MEGATAKIERHTLPLWTYPAADCSVPRLIQRARSRLTQTRSSARGTRMVPFRYLPLFALLSCLCGCASLEFLDPSLGETGTAPVPSNPFGSLAPEGTITRAAPSPTPGEG